MMRRVLIFGGALILLATLGIYLFWNPLAQVLVQRELRKAVVQGGNLGWKDLQVSGTTVTVKEVSGWIPIPLGRGTTKIPVSVNVEDLRVAVPFLSLLTASPEVNFGLRIYGGSLDGRATNVTNTPKITASLSGVDLASQVGAIGSLVTLWSRMAQPQLALKSFTVKSARLDVSVSEFSVAPPPETSGSFSVVLSEVEIPEIALTVSLIKIPPFKDGRVSIEGELNTGQAFLKKIVASSNWGDFTGWFKVAALGAGRGTCEGEGTVQLSDTGSTAFGQWIPLIAGEQFTPDTRRFKIRLTGVQRSGGSTSGCLRAGDFCLSIRYESVSDAG
jgi:hypothetical protein